MPASREARMPHARVLSEPPPRLLGRWRRRPRRRTTTLRFDIRQGLLRLLERLLCRILFQFRKMGYLFPGRLEVHLDARRPAVQHARHVVGAKERRRWSLTLHSTAVTSGT